MTVRPHLSRERLDACFEGREPWEALAEVTRLVEAECPECARRLAGRGAVAIDSLLTARRRERLSPEALEAEGRELPDLLRRLGDLSGPQILLEVTGHSRYHQLALAQYELAAAWAAVDGEAWSGAAEAADLAVAVAARLDPGRYGPRALTELQANAELATARVALARGDDAKAERALDTAAGTAPGLSAELAAGIALGSACLAVRAGREGEARDALEGAGEEAGRWRLSILTLQAMLDRRAGRPDLSAGRLVRLLDFGSDRPRDPAEWRAARELVLALLEDRRREDAEALVASWRKEDPQTGPARGRAATPELARLEGRLLRAAGKPDAAADRLRSAFEGGLAFGRGLWAAGVICQAARCRLEGARGTGWLSQAAEDLVVLEELPGEAREALARWGMRLWRGALAPEDVEELESSLRRVDLPWSAAP